MTYEYEIKPKLTKKLEKLAKRNPKDLQNIRKKIAQIIENPEHCKPLRGNMKNIREAHVNTSFVLTFKVQDDLIIFLDYAHKDEVYF